MNNLDTSNASPVACARAYRNAAESVLACYPWLQRRARRSGDPPDTVSEHPRLSPGGANYLKWQASNRTRDELTYRIASAVTSAGATSYRGGEA